ncbi:hypothetical protein SDC9_185865 [bioreactor metagenome]|uniref:Uncharacterized protein n=1 Tax=bioreactor metagenome TaxID=1076179 RepID=A0A645HH39_9ZZZZ
MLYCIPDFIGDIGISCIFISFKNSGYSIVFTRFLFHHQHNLPFYIDIFIIVIIILWRSNTVPGKHQLSFHPITSCIE